MPGLASAASWPARVFRRERTAFLAAAGVSLWLCLSLPVFAQEAYYWCYAKHPDLSYYDHPPMVAWWIWLGTHLLGNGALGIRLLTWLAGLGTSLAGLALLRSFGVDARGRLAWIALGAGVPGLVLTRFLANPDAPLLLFWTLTLLALWHARRGGLRWWVVAGLAAGAALTSKYTAVFLAAGGGIVLVVDPRMRAQWRRPGPYLGVVLAAVVFVPVVVWNAENHFESFRFQTESRFEHAVPGVHWFLQVAAGQFGMIHPFLAVLAPACVLWLARRSRTDVRSRWLLAFGLPLPLYLAANSFFIQVKINWFLPAFVPLLLGGVLWWRESDFAARRPRWAGVVRTAVLAVPLLTPLSLAVWLVPSAGGSSWQGWDRIAERAEHWEDKTDALDGVEGNVFFFCAGYRDAAQLTLALTRYTAAHPEPSGTLEPTMSDNVRGVPALEFDHWDRASLRVGQDAIFVLGAPERHPYEAMRVIPRFATVERVERVEVRRLGILLFDADVYVCRGYRGPVAQP